jgi:LysM repeat protein
LAVLVLALYAVRGAGAEAPTSYYVVEPGDTVWSITADRYPPQEDPRPWVHEIKEINDLTGFSIHPGQNLELPAAD